MNNVKGEGLRVKGETPWAISALPPSLFPLLATGGRT